MFRITDAEITGGTVSVKVEGETGFEKFVLGKEFFTPLGLSEGDEVGEAEYDALTHAAALSGAYAKALDILSYSGISRRALADKLRLKYKFDREIASEAADRAVEKGYLDEASDASRIAENDVKHKLWGKRRVAADLFSKGYSAKTAKDAANSVPDRDYEAALRRLADKKARAPLKDREAYNKAASSLVRLGHSPSDVRRVLDKKIDKE